MNTGQWLFFSSLYIKNLSWLDCFSQALGRTDHYSTRWDVLKEKFVYIIKKCIQGCHAAIAVTFAIHVLQVFLSFKYPSKIIEIIILILFTTNLLLLLLFKIKPIFMYCDAPVTSLKLIAAATIALFTWLNIGLDLSQTYYLEKLEMH